MQEQWSLPAHGGKYPPESARIEGERESHRVDGNTRRPQPRSELAGAGPLEGELRARAAALGLESAVRFVGQVPGAGPVLERAAVVVVPSLGEGFGMVALEAMERGRAVVASDVGGLPEIVAAGETGLLVPPGDVDALAAGIVELAGDLDRARTFGAAGRRRALEHFSQERCTERTEELYRSALLRQRKSRIRSRGSGTRQDP